MLYIYISFVFLQFLCSGCFVRDEDMYGQYVCEWFVNGVHKSFRVTFLIWGNSYDWSSVSVTTLNTLRPRQDGRRFPDDIFKCIFLNENARISLKKSLKFVPRVGINNIPALVQIMAWRRPGGKPLSEPMMVSLPTHIWVTRSQWVKIKMHDMHWATEDVNISTTKQNKIYIL